MKKSLISSQLSRITLLSTRHTPKVPSNKRNKFLLQQTNTHTLSVLLTEDDVSVPLHCLQQHSDLSKGEPWFGFQPSFYSTHPKLFIIITPRGRHGSTSAASTTLPMTAHLTVKNTCLTAQGLQNKNKMGKKKDKWEWEEGETIQREDAKDKGELVRPREKTQKPS